jgi:hypothetical protein
MAAVLLAAASARLVADPIILSIAPATETVSEGSIVSIAIDISGLRTDAAPALGAFDLEIGYDSSVLTDPTVTFGDPILGDQLALTVGSIHCTGLNASCGLSSMPIEIFELSLGSPATLESSQAGAFTLATITFDAISAGSSPINLENVTLADPFGDDLNANGGLRIENGQIDSGSIVVATPEPGGLLLLGSLFAGFLGMGRFRIRTN